MSKRHHHRPKPSVSIDLPDQPRFVAAVDLNYHVQLATLPGMRPADAVALLMYLAAYLAAEQGVTDDDASEAQAVLAASIEVHRNGRG